MEVQNNLAKKIIDEIREAERRAQEISANAEREARAVADEAEQKKAAAMAVALQDAQLKAQGMTDAARADSEDYLNAAKSQAQKIEEELCAAAAKNSDAAILKVIEVLKSK